jgi:hypothetical protein
MSNHHAPPPTRWMKRPMEISQEEFNQNWDRIFGKKDEQKSTNKSSGIKARTKVRKSGDK